MDVHPPKNGIYRYGSIPSQFSSANLGWLRMLRAGSRKFGFHSSDRKRLVSLPPTATANQPVSNPFLTHVIIHLPPKTYGFRSKFFITSQWWDGSQPSYHICVWELGQKPSIYGNVFWENHKLASGIIIWGWVKTFNNTMYGYW